MKHSKSIAVVSAVLLVAGLMALAPTNARAHDYHRASTDSHVIRLLAYALHPIGVALEFTITRPAHYLASRPKLDLLLGHKAKYDDVYFEWTHGDGTLGLEKY